MWFWAWVILAVIFAIAESVNGGLLVLPWSFGAAAAAVLDALGVSMGWQWLTFLLLSSALLVAGQRLIVQRRK
jgi:membrane protein implicated in regulation of membrane protease activity